MDFNPQVLLLFTNAFLTTALSVVIVGVILVREYRPTIRRLEQAPKEEDTCASSEPDPRS
ncbi:MULTISPECIES: hypothetical protein [Chromohalobacter]|jgi:hypothetical protein|uniref:Uncharacterized protein n=1 Tax=Chromohalobacter israelensis (strain ATCC BAA-138 / DSM 3043 / CIP 106854 / NCIMB 13768 / 1H11) TaxID=290398 RepID=Q1R1L4_CHRI1|nr:MULTISPECIES: hypothetical protein [Chromohalobacter]ABE57394.1 hypothetical protein Csal_0029 [Chromohalobacter salexigens DSM 3043]MBZ5875229.1 hypothetical protein [Chromohalobacter salexigens]MDO0945467.1 hypothetical protein [Chromohalobacter salexigens]NQY45576.1 hypothetical protein [Chromohalobacter sp.]NWO55350.1 hypothetical protein [Chromohalobacter salexigens]